MGVNGRTRFAPLVYALLLGCQAFDGGLLEREEEGVSADPRPRDSGGAGMDAAVCEPQPERCNGRDDDCDGKIDEGAEADCVFDHAVGACVAGGACVLAACDEGYADCNGVTEDGCEMLRADVPCGTCGRRCPDVTTPDAGLDDDGGAGPDAGEPPVCIPSPEICNDEDDDCDGWVDEAGACALEMCVAGTPTYRSAACDGCACERCGQQLADCQNHPDPMWAQLCRAVIECYRVHDARGECGDNADCYMSNTGPCAAEVNLAAGNTSGTATSMTAAGCAAGTPPVAPCAAAVNYRDQCALATCAAACGG
jgi:hypothetical protein